MMVSTVGFTGGGCSNPLRVFTVDGRVGGVIVTLRFESSSQKPNEGLGGVDTHAQCRMDFALWPLFRCFT